MKYDCLVLDHDDTVVQSSPSIHFPSFIEALSILRPERADMTFEYFIGQSFSPGIMSLLKDDMCFSEEEIALEQQIWRRYTQERTPAPYPGFAALLSHYREAGGKICVVSHSDARDIGRHYRTHFGFSPDLIFGWERPEAERKPSPFALDEIRRALGVPFDGMLMVDDLKPGMDMAAQRGVDFAWAGWSHTAPVSGPYMRAHAKHVFDTVEELERFVLG